MPSGPRIESPDLLALARDLKAADVQMFKDLVVGLKAGAKRLTPESRRVALQTLPSRGGLAARVARAPQRVVARAGRTTATVEVVLSGKKKGSGATQADAGTVRHPVFGNRSRFVAQSVRPGWFSRTAEFIAPDVNRDLREAMDVAARRLTER